MLYNTCLWFVIKESIINVLFKKWGCSMRVINGSFIWGSWGGGKYLKTEIAPCNLCAI